MHLTHIGYPIVGDPLYGKRSVKQKGLPAAAIEVFNGFPRQALHARTLRYHPRIGTACAFRAPLADDLDELIDILKRARTDE